MYNYVIKDLKERILIKESLLIVKLFQRDIVWGLKLRQTSCHGLQLNRVPTSAVARRSLNYWSILTVGKLID